MRVSIIAMCLLGAALASTPKEKNQAALKHKAGPKKISTKKLHAKKLAFKKRLIMKKRGQGIGNMPEAPPETCYYESAYSYESDDEYCNNAWEEWDVWCDSTSDKKFDEFCDPVEVAYELSMGIEADDGEDEDWENWTDAKWLAWIEANDSTDGTWMLNLAKAGTAKKSSSKNDQDSDEDEDDQDSDEDEDDQDSDEDEDEDEWDSDEDEDQDEWDSDEDEDEDEWELPYGDWENWTDAEWQAWIEANDSTDGTWMLNLAKAGNGKKSGSNFGKGFAVGASVGLMTVAGAFYAKSKCSGKTDDFQRV